MSISLKNPMFEISNLTIADIKKIIFQEVIKKVDGGWKVYPKKPKKGEKRRKALSKNPHKTYSAALKQLRAVERSKSMRSESIKLQSKAIKSIRKEIILALLSN